MSFDIVLLGFLLTFLAGLATVIGALMACFSKKPNPDFLTVALGLSAGIMLYIAFIELFPEAKSQLSAHFGSSAYLLSTIGFFIGFIFMIIIEERIHFRIKESDDKHLLRIGILTALAIAIHNFPEGIATFIATIDKPALGINTAFAVALHNIPVGLAIALPIYYATKRKSKAIKYALLSGMVEPLGAIVTYLILMPFMNETILGFIFAFVSGMMIYLAIFELLRHAFEYQNRNKTIIGFTLGLLLMAFSMIFLQ